MFKLEYQIWYIDFWGIFICKCLNHHCIALHWIALHYVVSQTGLRL